MRSLYYYWFALLAYARGILNVRNKMQMPTCTTGLNGKGEAKTMYIKHNWVPYIYRYCKATKSYSRTFITSDSK